MHLCALQEPDSAPNPDLLNVGDYRRLLTLSNTQRKRYYRYMFKNQFTTKDNRVSLWQFAFFFTLERHFFLESRRFLAI